MDEQFMRRAIALAEKGVGRVNPNPLVGAVIVKNGVIIGEGYHEKYGGLHAERNAFKNCKASPEGADMYVTLEPCPMCAGAILNARIENVYFGAYDKKSGCAGSAVNLFDKGLCNYSLTTRGGVMEHECAAVLKDFFKSLRNSKKDYKTPENRQ